MSLIQSIYVLLLRFRR